MKRAFLPLICLLMIIFSTSAEAMTIRAEANPELLPGLIEIGQPFTIDIYMNNNDTVEADPTNGYRLSYSTPFGFYSPDGSILNVSHLDVGGEGPTGNIVFYNGFDDYWDMYFGIFDWSYDGALPDSLNFTGISNAGWPFGLGEQLYIQFSFQSSEEGTFCIDSIGGQSTTFDWLLDPPSPAFNGPYCWEIGTLPTDPEIGVSHDSMYFEGVAGQSPPPAQTLTIDNIGVGTLNWTASWNSSWLSVSPAFGTNLSVVQVFANTIGLSSGTYYDTITISDPNATNNPVLIPVTLVLVEPPPVFSLSDDSFNFFAVADSSDPDDQYLTINNIGGSSLNWTATHNESWLTLTPDFGGDGETITLSIDITGLAYGIYYDDITISDPNATNDPQTVQVKLEIASSLPLLGVEPSFIFVAIDTDDPLPDNKQFLVFNEGAGSMNYYLEESSDYIISLSPDSGSVPNYITVAFDSIPGFAGFNVFDTVWVYSDEASNSPLPIVFQFHYSDNPARIIASKDSLIFNLHECGQGVNPPALANLSVYNGGGDPFNFAITNSEAWLTYDPISGPAPDVIYFDVDYRTMPVGVYYDSLIITAYNATNSPVIVPVVLNLLPTEVTPEVWTNFTDTLIFASQEERVGKEFTIDVNNKYPGCMDWHFQESISWINFSIDSSDNRTYPWDVEFAPNGFGMLMGEYIDSGFIVADDASNSPYKLDFKVYIWKLHGDLNYDGIVNIFDIAYFIKYLYRSGPPPLPEMAVADCDCDYRINLFDITAIIDYLYRDAGPLCGNPY